MHIILLRAHIDIPGAHSLKEKRRVVKSLKESTVARMNVSVAEVGQHEIWNRAELAFITVAAESEVVDKRVSKIIHRLETGSDWILLEVKTEKL